MTRTTHLDAKDAGLVTIVVPAKNEEAVIGPTLRSLPLATLRAAGHDVEVIVLDGKSEDRTAAISEAWGATVLRDRQEGKGAALRNAVEHFKGDYVVMLDADGTYPPDAIPRVLGPLVRGEADVVMGRRRPQPGSMKPTHRAGNMLLSLQASALYLRPCPDLCTGLWGFKTEALHALPLRAEGFELEAELFALSSRIGLNLTTIEVDYLQRADGDPKLSGRRDGLRISWWLLRTRVIPLSTTPTENGHGPHAPGLVSGGGER